MLKMFGPNHNDTVLAKMFILKVITQVFLTVKIRIFIFF